MNSSRTALAVLIAVWFVATLLLTSAHTRALANEARRRRRYVIAWIVCVVVLGALLTAMDNATGRTDLGRGLANFAIAGSTCAIALGVGAWWTNRPLWARLGGAARYVTLALIQAVAVLLSAYAFI